MEQGEGLRTVVPKKNIVCKDCKFKMPDVVVRGETYHRHTFGQCQMYEYPDAKPDAVLFGNSKCDFYVKE